MDLTAFVSGYIADRNAGRVVVSDWSYLSDMPTSGRLAAAAVLGPRPAPVDVACYAVADRVTCDSIYGSGTYVALSSEDEPVPVSSVGEHTRPPASGVSDGGVREKETVFDELVSMTWAEIEKETGRVKPEVGREFVASIAPVVTQEGEFKPHWEGSGYLLLSRVEPQSFPSSLPTVEQVCRYTVADDPVEMFPNKLPSFRCVVDKGGTWVLHLPPGSTLATGNGLMMRGGVNGGYVYGVGPASFTATNASSSDDAVESSWWYASLSREDWACTMRGRFSYYPNSDNWFTVQASSSDMLWAPEAEATPLVLPVQQTVGQEVRRVLPSAWGRAFSPVTYGWFAVDDIGDSSVVVGGKGGGLVSLNHGELVVTAGCRVVLARGYMRTLWVLQSEKVVGNSVWTVDSGHCRPAACAYIADCESVLLDPDGESGLLRWCMPLGGTTGRLLALSRLANGFRRMLSSDYSVYDRDGVVIDSCD
jgi:hypothetical protein